MTPRTALLLLPLLALLGAVQAAVAQPVKGAPSPPAVPPAARTDGPDLPPDLLSCVRLGGETADPNAREAERTRVALRDGRVATVVLDLPGGRATRTDLTPGRRDGTSLRLIAFPRPGAGASGIGTSGTGASGAWNTVFNHATVEAEGTILVETWIAYTDRPAAPPVHNWYRLRCGTGAPPPASPPGARPGAKG